MSFLSNIFGKEEPINSYSDFWKWFQANERNFYEVVKNSGNINQDFFDKVSPKMDQLKGGMYFLAGMPDENTVEFIITADGDLKNIAFAEDIVAAAPDIQGWKFTALKPEAGEVFEMRMGEGLMISDKNLSFYSNESWEQPDLIKITFVHDDLNEENREMVSNGIYIYLDNYLGEIALASDIDELEIVSISQAKEQALHLSELKPYLAKRKSAFIEKYDGIRLNTDEDAHSILEAEFENGLPYIAVVNSTLLKWDRKPSHPWLSRIDIDFGGNDVGLADEEAYEMLQDIEDEIVNELKDVNGYLNVARETAKGVRSVYFACKEFRKPSKIFYSLQKKYSTKLNIEYVIYKDKYWQSLDQFIGEDDGGMVN